MRSASNTGLAPERSAGFLKDHFRPFREHPEGLLLEMAKAGNRDAFGELVNRHLALSYIKAAPLVGHGANAKDISLQSFQNAFEHLDQFDGRSKFSSWLIRIVVNECYQFMRSTRNLTTPFEERDHSPTVHSCFGRGLDPEAQASHMEMAALVARELRRVPMILREPLLLRLQEKSGEEIAVALGISHAAVKSRLKRAIEHLRTRLRRHLPTEIAGLPQPCSREQLPGGEW